ncbi:MAG: BlaI/MecI/CopY family transcriptional regulator [Bacillota bacterium]
MGKFSEFKPHEQGLEKALGGLESKVMNAVWSIGRCTVREVYDRLRVEQDLAYTTVMTVMSRLSNKGFLKREMVDGSYFYESAMSRQEFRSALVGEVLDSLLESFSEETVAHLADRVGKRSSEDLDKLSDVIAERRKERGK